MTKHAHPFAWALTAVAATMTVLSGGCRNQPDYPSLINVRLRAAHLEQVAAEWDDARRSVRLTGVVDSDTDRDKAETIAVAVVGTSVRLSNAITVAAPRVNDAAIRNQLERIAGERRWRRSRHRVALSVSEGVVTATGSLASEADRQALLASVRGITDVTTIVDQITISTGKRKRPAARTPPKPTRSIRERARTPPRADATGVSPNVRASSMRTPEMQSP